MRVRVCVLTVCHNLLNVRGAPEIFGGLKVCLKVYFCATAIITDKCWNVQLV